MLISPYSFLLIPGTHAQAARQLVASKALACRIRTVNRWRSAAQNARLACGSGTSWSTIDQYDVLRLLNVGLSSRPLQLQHGEYLEMGIQGQSLISTGRDSVTYASHALSASTSSSSKDTPERCFSLHDHHSVSAMSANSSLREQSSTQTIRDQQDAESSALPTSKAECALSFSTID